MAAMTTSLLPRLTALALALASSCCASAPEEPALAEPFRVLLLGDSISIGYTPFVQEALAGRAHVARPMLDGDPPRAENCAGTTKGIAELDRWLAPDGGAWDVVHVNFGLHDLKRVDAATGQNSNDPADPHQADLARYEPQLRDIVTRLQATGARVVLATTTPVPDGELRPYRAPQDAALYNRVALRVAQEAGVAVNDLHAFVLAQPPPFQRANDVHFDAAGSRALGERVAAAVLEVAGHGERP